MLMGIDLHVHSTYSDGTWSTKQILNEAQNLGIPAIALTDHDTLVGAYEILNLAKDSPVEVIPGIELSTRLNGEDIHILGYYPDFDNTMLKRGLADILSEREQRNLKMMSLLRQNGVDITYDAIRNEFPNRIITRATIGAFLLKHGYVRSIHEAFHTYIGVGCPCYLPRNTLSPKEGVRFLKDANASVFIAHPGLYSFEDDEFEATLKELMDNGLDGIECYHPSHDEERTFEYLNITRKYGLLASGGSDFHGDNKPGIFLGTGRGSMYVPYHMLELIKKSRGL